MTIQTLNTIAYALVAFLLVQAALRHRPSAYTKAAIGLHLVIVTVRPGLLEWWPQSVLWDWAAIHMTTIICTSAIAAWEYIDYYYV